MITIETKNGKRAYETVAERVKKFRATYPVDSGWQLLTEIEFPKDGLVLCRAKILDPNGRVVATGTAEEVRGSTFINKTSAVENAETSAIGRALFAAGFGGGEFCSADELMAAVKRQEELLVAEKAAKTVAKPVALPQEDRGAVHDGGPYEQDRVPFGPSEGSEALSPALFGLPEDCGIEFIQQDSVIVARDRRKGATFNSKQALKAAGFSFDGSQRVWFKKAAVADEIPF